ncbi:MAG: ATP-binding protein [Bacillota bacterium]|nr:ATP-binding protein [Bacillota bacterium]
MKMKFDFKSLKFKLWFYFVMFAILLMAILWCLQIFFFQSYYQEMKAREIISIADSIASDYGELDFEKMAEYSYKDDVFIQLETDAGLVIYTPGSDSQRPSIIGRYQDMTEIREKLKASDTGTVSITLGHDSNTILVYGKRITESSGAVVNLYVYAPLAPVESTIDILLNQLIMVTILSLLLAFGISFFLAKRITRPLVKITNSAAQLGQGRYDVPFEGGDYSEIIRLADTLTYTSKELAKADDLQKDLLANVSHDLRTPLTMVRSYAEMIRDLSGDCPEKRNAHLQVIIEEADRLNLLVNDMLVLSRMQSGVAALEASSFLLAEAAESMLSSYSILEEQEGYQLIFRSRGDTLVSADEQKIKQVLANLITNALRYGGEDKQVIVQVEETDSGVRCSVTDHGQGIPQEQLEEIWKRYYKASAHLSRSVSGGSGLGLAIVKEILTLHKARFGVKSQVGKGSTFWFELPGPEASNPGASRKSG